MEGFTLVDAGVAGLILISAFLAWSRGFVREALAIGGWVLAAVAGFMAAPFAATLLQQVPQLGSLLADSCELAVIAGFSVVFAVTLILMSFITPLFSSAVRDSAISGVDHGLGFAFGAFRGILLVAVALFLYQTLAAGSAIAMISDSRSAEVFNGIATTIENSGPERALGWITDRYEALVTSCR